MNTTRNMAGLNFYEASLPKAYEPNTPALTTIIMLLVSIESAFPIEKVYKID